MVRAVGAAEAIHGAPHATAAAKTASDTAAPVRAEGGGDAKANHAAQRAAAGPKALSDAVAPAQTKAVTEANPFDTPRPSQGPGDKDAASRALPWPRASAPGLARAW